LVRYAGVPHLKRGKWFVFKAKYATFGFSDLAILDEGKMWLNSFALTDIVAKDEAKIIELVKQSVKKIV